MAKAGNPYDIDTAFRRVEDELMSSMVRNLKKYHLDWEKAEDKQWEQWQVVQLKELEKYRQKYHKKFGGVFRDINAKIDGLLRNEYAGGQLDQEREILKAIKNGFKAQKVSPGMSAKFFRLNERKLEALIKATTSDMQKAEYAVLRRAEDQYRQIIYNAQVYANTGAGTYEKAVDMATKDFLASGINCIEYKNGARHTISDYADMAIKTAAKRAYLQGEGVKRQEWGIYTVVVNKRGGSGSHGGACPHCIPWLGKILIDDVWSGGPKSGKSPQTGKKYPLMSEAIAAGLYHPRCKDSHTTYFEGLSTPPKPATKQDVKEAVAEEKQEQRENYAQRQAEKYERLANGSLDPENQQAYEARSESWKSLTKDYASGPVMSGLNAPAITNSEEIVEEFINSIEMPDDPDVVACAKKSVRHMPKDDLDMIRKNGVIIKKTKGPNVFEGSKQVQGKDGNLKYVIKINPYTDEPFVFAHECAHFAEKVNDLYHDSEFKKVLENFWDSIYTDAYGENNGELFYVAVSDLLIEPYQGRTYLPYEKVLRREVKLMPEHFVEYISDGYECFVGDPKLLETKDPMLYNYFRRRGLR